MTAAPRQARPHPVAKQRLQKSPQAFRTISEVAGELHVQQHVLRFWETKFSQIKPLKRGGGRRYYRPEDVDLLRGIRTLLHYDGYTIKGVRKVLRDYGLKHVTDIGRAERTTERDAELDAEQGPAATPPTAAAPILPITLTEAQQEALERILDDLLSLKAKLEAARRGGEI